MTLMRLPNGSMLLTATIVVLTATLLLQPIVQVNATARPGDYIVTGQSSDVIYAVTPGGVGSVIYTFAAGTEPVGVAIDSAGNYIVTEYFGVLSRITPGGTRTVISAAISNPVWVAIDSAGNYIVIEAHVLSKITPGGTRTVIYSFTGGTTPEGVAIDSAGNYIVAERDTHVLSKITPGGTRTVIYSFGAGTSTQGVAIDSSGNYIVTDYNGFLYRITSGGVLNVIYTFAGFATPIGVAIDSAGNYIVAERGNNVLSKITPSGTRTIILTFPPQTEPFGVAIVPVTALPVGGLVMPANKLEILTPYLTLAGLAAALSAVVVVKKRRD